MDDFQARVFQRKYLPQWLFAGGVLLVIISAFVWWTQVYTNPYNVYWDMLANSLSTTSVTKHVTESGNGTQLDQYIGQEFGVNTLAYGRTTLSSKSSTVKTESVGTLQNDYVRYTDISTTQKTKSGKQRDFSKALDKWAKTSAANDSSQGSTPFFAQTMLGLGGGNVVPMADLTSTQRQNLLNQLHQSVIFNTSFSKVQKHKSNGRQVYTYTVSVEPVGYVAFEKAFAADVGIKALDNVDPNGYQGEQPIQVKLTVDVRSHRLTQVSYEGAQHEETYSSYGVPVDMKLPKATLSSQALQNLVNQTQ